MRYVRSHTKPPGSFLTVCGITNRSHSVTFVTVTLSPTLSYTPGPIPSSLLCSSSFCPPLLSLTFSVFLTWWLQIIQRDLLQTEIGLPEQCTSLRHRHLHTVMDNKIILFWTVLSCYTLRSLLFKNISIILSHNFNTVTNSEYI